MAAQGPVRIQLIGSLNSDISSRIRLFLEKGEEYSEILNSESFCASSHKILAVDYHGIQLNIADQEKETYRVRVRGVYSRAMPKPQVYAICIPLEEQAGFSVALELLKQITESPEQKSRIQEKKIAIVLIGVNEYPIVSEKPLVIDEKRIRDLAILFETENLPVKTVFLNAKVKEADEKQEKSKIFEVIYNLKHGPDLKKEFVSNIQNTKNSYNPLRQFFFPEKNSFEKEKRERRLESKQKIKDNPIKALKDDFACQDFVRKYYEVPAPSTDENDENNEKRLEIERQLRDHIEAFGREYSVNLSDKKRTLALELLQLLKPSENKQKNKLK